MKIHLLANHKRIVILFWALIISIFWIQFLNMAPFAEATALAFSICGVIGLMNHHLTNHLLEKAIRKKRMFLFFIQFTIMSLLTALTTASIYCGFRHLERVGFFAPSRLFFEDDRLISDFVIMLPGSVVINLAFCGLRFYYEHAQLEKANRKLQFKALQDQITPHFMFNVLNHIHVLMQENVDLASSLLIKYSDILRYQLYQSQKELISLEQEIQFLKNYIEVERIRWEDKLDVTCSWEIEGSKLEIPPLLLITFIENAFKHVSRSSSAKGYIYIHFEQSAHTLRLHVENSKTKTDPGKEVSGLGLENVRRRLDILYSKNYTLTSRETDIAYNIQLMIQM